MTQRSERLRRRTREDLITVKFKVKSGNKRCESGNPAIHGGDAGRMLPPPRPWSAKGEGARYAVVEQNSDGPHVRASVNLLVRGLKVQSGTKLGTERRVRNNDRGCQLCSASMTQILTYVNTGSLYSRFGTICLLESKSGPGFHTHLRTALESSKAL
jgi:hypothetical protein